MDPIIEAVLAAAAAFFVVTSLFAVIFALCQRKSRSKDRPRRRGVALSSVAVGEESVYFDVTLNQISMTELLRATDNFSPELIIGDGSFGFVYKARLSSGATVAVKKLAADAFQGIREFRAEMETLGKIKHPNIVTILGYCSTGSDRVLIYEFIEKGSLDQWLLDTSSSSSDTNSFSYSTIAPLPWTTRLKIIKGVATGLDFMHNLDTPIIHRDIKASNVLLDSEFEAHIADFGLARRIEGSHSHVSTQMAGTMGYMPPEYLHGASMATVAGDVYSFGILMLEIATGLRPNLQHKWVGEEKEMSLVEWARKMVAQDEYMVMLDPSVSSKGLSEESVVEFFKIAVLCTDEVSKFRPTMNQVLELLEKTKV